MITGVLESIEREEAKSLIERYGGKVTGNVSKKTSYLVMGRDSGQSKSDKVGSATSSHRACLLQYGSVTAVLPWPSPYRFVFSASHMLCCLLGLL